ncbi:hypothetical protein LJC63_12385 [Ruminococcaceae bacterium OttesenSCG-928-L11]|nr:hypothetical protein [Ruminococcaceae bacterium OttesenSCG-928-L11]
MFAVHNYKLNKIVQMYQSGKIDTETMNSMVKDVLENAEQMPHYNIAVDKGKYDDSIWD